VVSTGQAKATTASATAAAAKTGAAAKVGTMATLSAYEQFRARNTRFDTQLQSMFREFDRDRDDAINIEHELPLLVEEAIITQPQANIISSWDLNGDGKISESEFTNGPLYVSLLEFNPPLQAAYEKAVDTEDSQPDLKQFTSMFARLSAGSSDDLPKFSRMRFSDWKAGDKTEEDQAVEDEYEAEQDDIEAAENDDTARFAERRGRRRRRKTRAKLTATQILALKRPRSKWGIPSSRDENCVLCQYLVQRIQKQLYYTLANSADGFPADPNAEISAKKMRQVNAQLLNRRGGKGLLRIMAEDIVSDMCNADQMPELFYPACKKIDKRMPVLLDAIYFQFHSEAVCEEARFCNSRTYFNRPSSVHLPSKSKIFNAARGRCGLMGGAHERPTKCFSSALCFAKHLFKM